MSQQTSGNAGGPTNPFGAGRRAVLAAAAGTAALGAALTGVGAPPAAAGARTPDRDRPATAQLPSRELRALLREIDRDRIEATVRKLASFGTRHTLSGQDDPKRGIGAARDWILAELKRYATGSGGRMTVELQSYIQEPVRSGVARYHRARVDPCRPGR
ncbi:hypothetical protein AB0D12_03210 [Streptomyces sp. NPDC048479]|uniref:hypothetical protein n=1 Tax=Streptomyces sp. NPDC048479 TaxID=3154725 RepID=UPI0034489F22